LTNGTTADASQVQQNFNDLLNGITDGSKDLSIAALTASGAATLNGHVTLGSASNDDLTFNGSLASTIPIKTTNTYSIGSATLGLAGAYFGTGSTQTARIVAAASFAGALTYTLLERAQTFTGLKTFDGGVLLKGVTSGVGVATSYVGEFVSSQVSGGTTTAADTWTATTGSISLTAGIWLIGFDVSLDITTADANVTVAGNVAIYNSTDAATLDDTIGYASMSDIQGAGDLNSIPMSRKTVVNITGTKVYALRTRCGRASSGTATDGSIVIVGTSETSTLTNPDNSSLLWAVRIA
jgi:hypothetical protein